MRYLIIILALLFAISASSLTTETNIFASSLDHITIASSVFSTSPTDQIVTVTYTFDPLYTIVEANTSGVPEMDCAIDNEQHTVVCVNVARQGQLFDVHIVARIGTLPCNTRQAHITTNAVSGSDSASDDTWLLVNGQNCRIFLPIVSKGYVGQTNTPVSEPYPEP